MNNDLTEINIDVPMNELPRWDKHSCIRCIACVGSCPVAALRYSNNRILVLEETCIGCGRCTKLCPVGAFSVEVINDG
jgi:ferredoxin